MSRTRAAVPDPTHVAASRHAVDLFVKDERSMLGKVLRRYSLVWVLLPELWAKSLLLRSSVRPM